MNYLSSSCFSQTELETVEEGLRRIVKIYYFVKNLYCFGTVNISYGSLCESSRKTILKKSQGHASKLGMIYNVQEFREYNIIHK